MPIEYKKDTATGVVLTNGDGTVALSSPTRPQGDATEWVAGRNHSGRVFIPGDKVAFSVVVKTKNAEYNICSGITNSPTAGKLTPVYVRVRQETEAIEPTAPVVEIG